MDRVLLRKVRLLLSSVRLYNKVGYFVQLRPLGVPWLDRYASPPWALKGS